MVEDVQMLIGFAWFRMCWFEVYSCLQHCLQNKRPETRKPLTSQDTCRVLAFRKQSRFDTEPQLRSVCMWLCQQRRCYGLTAYKGASAHVKSQHLRHTLKCTRVRQAKFEHYMVRLLLLQDLGLHPLSLLRELRLRTENGSHRSLHNSRRSASHIGGDSWTGGPNGTALPATSSRSMRELSPDNSWTAVRNRCTSCCTT